MSKKEQRKRSDDPLPPNFADLAPEMKKAVEEQICKQQSIGTWGYHRGDKRLKSSDKIDESYNEEED